MAACRHWVVPEATMERCLSWAARKACEGMAGGQTPWSGSRGAVGESKHGPPHCAIHPSDIS